MSISRTRHARLRAAQRALNPAAMEAALYYGREWRQSGGTTVHYLGDRQVAAAARQGADLRAFRGVTLIVAEDRVVTLYRSRRAPRRQGRRG
ncbi:MAG: hypothetical protein IV100_00880 [Myxococcales bacterium]|nr:hypothetical protein [Myxococcales bacterium]